MMNRPIDRRCFLKLAAVAGGGAIAGGALSACASESAETQSPARDVASSQAAAQQDPETPPQPVAGKVLVAYFSGTGNTRAVAERIALQTGGQLFEIAPEQPYSESDLDWRDDGSRVTREHEDRSLRDIALAQTAPDDFAEYETVFVGYPIWWQMAAWPVNRFMRDNDFTRKTVVAFCTSQSSSIGSTRQDLEQLAGSGEWLDGQRFAENPQDGIVENWVESLSI